MDESADAPEESVAVAWQREDATSLAAPVERRLPYAELTLEHPDLTPTGHEGGFFPDAVPYERDGEGVVFYWRDALAPDSPAPADWRLACATPHRLAGVAALPHSPSLVRAGTTADTLVVDGTVAGESTVARVRSYSPPAVELRAVSATTLELVVDGDDHSVAAGTRATVDCPAQTVHRVDGDREAVTVRPELTVRYAGERTVVHPAPGGPYSLFPSFDLDLAAVPRPVSVPTAGGELDDGALAAALGVDLAARPYPERVLWQAFAYAAFDPHAETTPRLAQFPAGRLAVLGDA